MVPKVLNDSLKVVFDYSKDKDADTGLFKLIHSGKVVSSNISINNKKQTSIPNKIDIQNLICTGTLISNFKDL